MLVKASRSVGLDRLAAACAAGWRPMRVLLFFGGPSEERDVSAGSIKPWVTYLQADPTAELTVVFVDRALRAYRLPPVYYYANTCADFETQLRDPRPRARLGRGGRPGPGPRRRRPAHPRRVRRGRRAPGAARSRGACPTCSAGPRHSGAPSTRRPATPPSAGPASRCPPTAGHPGRPGPVDRAGVLASLADLVPDLRRRGGPAEAAGRQAAGRGLVLRGRRGPAAGPGPLAAAVDAAIGHRRREPSWSRSS